MAKVGIQQCMRLHLFPTVEAPSQARRQVASLATDIDQGSLSDVTTVVSELVTISVAHGASRPIEISLDVDDGRLEGSVCDEGPGTRALTRARSRQDSSLVLQIVDNLVEDWGTNAAQRIWFRMPVRPVGRDHS
jgi:anti-sigma regulatory factor (Ser/Thr protein kinase)